jgi:DNA-directed RNA polymerase subunit omega
VSGVTGVPEGITNPPIDELLSKVDSKYALVLYSAKRARQINAYYSQLGEGLLEYVGPLVDTHVQEKPLSIAMREINADLLTYERFEGEIDPATGLEVEISPAFGLDGGVAVDAPAPTDG